MPKKNAMRGIFFLLLTGIRWENLPCEIGRCGMTCWRRLKAWQELDVWDSLHQLLLAALRKAGKLDLSIAIVNSTTSRAVGGGEDAGPNPTDRRKPGTKQHLMVNCNGVPSEMLSFPDEGHWVLKALNSRYWHEAVFGWMTKYL